MIKSFRGLLAHNAQDKIPLHTNDGRNGYRIVKFAVIPKEPTSLTGEAVVQIWTGSTTPTDVIDFSDQTLLGSAFYNQDSTAANNISQTIIFDNEVFNQDMYITNIEGLGSSAMNYYIELEEVPLGSLQATVVTLKDMRGRNTT